MAFAQRCKNVIPSSLSSKIVWGLNTIFVELFGQLSSSLTVVCECDFWLGEWAVAKQYLVSKRQSINVVINALSPLFRHDFLFSLVKHGDKVLLIFIINNNNSVAHLYLLINE